MGPLKKESMALDLKKHELLQAVVVADSFDSTFGPLTDDLPRCLLPLANRPILGYTLEFLKNSGVEETFVYCSSFAHKIKRYLEETEWTNPKIPSSMNVVVITNEDCRSFGDAMRDLDGKGLLRNDFILLSGDTVSNVDLKPFLEAHKERARNDKTSCMTLVYKKAAPGHHCRTLEEEVVLATNARDGKILHHQRASSSKLNIPLEVFEEHSEVELRFDLLDPCISICSHAIPPLFADNFDLQTLDDFVHGILENDLLDNTIYMAQINDAYAARISNFFSYMAVNTDVLNRWLYPIVPDASYLHQQHKSKPYKFHRHNVYKCDNVQLMRGCLLEKDVILGPSCAVGFNSTLSSSSVGANCIVGNNASIKNCIVFDGVKLGDGCRVSDCILAKGVKLGDGAVIDPKCVLGEGVVIGKGVKVPGETRLVAKKASDGFSDDDEESEQGDKHSSTGYGPKAFVFVDDRDSDSESDDSAHQLVRDMWGLALDDCEVQSSSSEEDSEFNPVDTFPTDILLDEDAKISVFHGEIFDSLQRGAMENVDAKNLVVEINSSRYAYNATQGDVIHSVITSLLAIATGAEDGASGAKLLKSAQKVLGHFTPLLETYCKSDVAQVGCLYGLEEHCKNHPDFLEIAKNTIHFLYEQDVLSEESIMQWFADKEKKFPEFGQTIRDKVRPFITWLAEADSDDESD